MEANEQLLNELFLGQLEDIYDKNFIMRCRNQEEKNSMIMIDIMEVSGIEYNENVCIRVNSSFVINKNIIQDFLPRGLTVKELQYLINNRC